MSNMEKAQCIANHILNNNNMGVLFGLIINTPIDILFASNYRKMEKI